MALVPDRPIYMSEMAPYEKPEESMTEKEFLRHMPSKGAAASAVAILFTLSNLFAPPDSPTRRSGGAEGPSPLILHDLASPFGNQERGSEGGGTC